MKTNSKSLAFLTTLTVVIGTVSSATQGGPVSYGYFGFTKVADTGTPVPDGVGEFDGADRRLAAGFDAPAIDGSNVAFKGRDDTTLTDGIYLCSGGILSKIVDEDTAVPENPSGSFTGFSEDISLEGATVAFEGLFELGGLVYEGVYTAAGGVLTKVADAVNTVVPGTGEVFRYVDEPALSADKVAFEGEDASGFSGIYRYVSGSLQAVVDTNTTVPEHGVTFSGFDSDVSMDGATVAFKGFFSLGIVSCQGVYAANGGLPTKIADTVTTNVPGADAPFLALQEPSIDDGNVVFGGKDPLDQWGIYTTLGGALRAVADHNTEIPGGFGFFTAFDTDDYAIDGNKIVFEGYGSNGLGGLYFETGGSLLKIIDTNDTLDDKSISDLDIGFDRAVSGSRVAFTATFSDNSAGIFVAEIGPDGSVSLTKIADTNTPVPDGLGSFDTSRTLSTGLGLPAVDGRNVAFQGRDRTSLADGIYIFDGETLSKLADESNPVPENPSGNFLSFSEDISLEGTTVAFEGLFEVGGVKYEGVYTTTGVLTKVADTLSTTIPGTGEVFRHVDEPALSGGSVAFEGAHASGFEGIYSNVSGSLQAVVDMSSSVPEHGVVFNAFDSDISLMGDTIAFEGSFKIADVNHWGVYTSDGSTLTKVADSVTTIVPGGAGVFASLDEASLDGGYVVFSGEDSVTGEEGVYTNLGGLLRKVADEGTFIPGLGRTFRDFDEENCAIDGNSIAFKGYGYHWGGVYAEIDGSLYKVIAEGDTLDGKLVTNVRIGHDRAVSGGRIAFRATFADDSVGVYVAEVFKGCPGLTADLSRDGSVNLLDFAIFAAQWLESCP